MTLKEVSEKTNQTRNTTAMQIHRGVEKLKILARISSLGVFLLPFHIA